MPTPKRCALPLKALLRTGRMLPKRCARAAADRKDAPTPQALRASLRALLRTGKAGSAQPLSGPNSLSLDGA